jgi:hypothetical protein
MVVGIAKRARENASIARDFFPGVFLANASISFAITISGHPPPSNTLLSLTV